MIHYNRELDPTDESGKTLTVEEYIDVSDFFLLKSGTLPVAFSEFN